MKRIIRKVGIVCILLTIICFNALADQNPSEKIDYVAKLNEYSKPNPYDPNDNGWPYLKQAIDQFVPYPNDLNKEYGQWPTDLKEPKRIVLQNWVKSNQTSIELLIKAALKPYIWYEYQSTDGTVTTIPLPHAADIRSLALLSSYSSKVAASKGQYEYAYELLNATYRIGFMIHKKRVTVEQMIGFAIRIFAFDASRQILFYTEPPQNILLQYQNKLQRLSKEYHVLFDYRSEKIFVLEVIQSCFDDNGIIPEEIPPEFIDPNLLKSTSLIRRETIDLLNKQHQFINDTLVISPYELKKKDIDIDAELKKMLSANPFMSLFRLAAGPIHTLLYRLQVSTNSVILLFAIERFENDNGYYPDNLQKLVEKNYIEQLPKDPFSPGDFTYKKTRDSFILYSYSSDCDDDGGDHDPKWAADGDGDYVFWPVQKR